MVSAIGISALYLPQALLPLLVSAVGTSTTAAGLLLGASQLGYAVGLATVLPAGSPRTARTRFIPQVGLLALLLAAAALQTTLVSLAILLFGIGLVATIGQSMIAVAYSQSPPGQARNAVGTITTVMIFATFGGRLVVGLMTESVHWRSVFLLLALTTAVSMLVLRLSLERPDASPAPRPRYRTELGATATLLREDAELRRAGVMQATVFGAFTAMWTVILLHLTAPPLSWSVAAANSSAALGLLGSALATLTLRSRSGARSDSLALRPVLSILVGACLLWVVAPDSYLCVAIALFVLTWANQTSHAVRQSSALGRTGPADHAKANSVFMCFVFLGGAAGATTAPLLFEAGGLPAVGAVCAGVVAWGLVTSLRAAE